VVLLQREGEEGGRVKGKGEKGKGGEEGRGRGGGGFASWLLGDGRP